MSNKLVEFIENSFLKDLLKIDTVTDISYNGEDIYYQDNILGRQKYTLPLTNQKAYDFIRQIANLSDSQFSFQSPILDVSVDRYRINATHFALARKNREQAINFSIRIGYTKLRIKDDEKFITKKCLSLAQIFLKKRLSIIIGGTTSSGKTELQKYLISKLDANSRLIILDNVEELETDDFLNDIDSQTWLLRKNLDLTYNDLIKNALRNNPDWLVLSEARGKEMLSILNAAMTGHPTISTIHAKGADFVYRRMARMCLQNGENLRYKEVLEDLYDHFKIIFYVNKSYDNEGKIFRYLDKIGTNYHNKYYELYSFPNTYHPFPEDFKKELNLSDDEFNFINNAWTSQSNFISYKENAYEKTQYI